MAEKNRTGVFWVVFFFLSGSLLLKQLFQRQKSHLVSLKVLYVTMQQ